MDYYLTTLTITTGNTKPWHILTNSSISSCRKELDTNQNYFTGSFLQVVCGIPMCSYNICQRLMKFIWEQLTRDTSGAPRSSAAPHMTKTSFLFPSTSEECWELLSGPKCLYLPSGKCFTLYMSSTYQMAPIVLQMGLLCVFFLQWFIVNRLTK